MRGLSNRFLNAMRDGLNRGRRKGKVGWDRKWEKVAFYGGPVQSLKLGLYLEIEELILALDNGNPDCILKEAADVANFAMFLADINQAS